MTPKQAALRLGISERTVFRRLAHLPRAVVRLHLTPAALSALGLVSDDSDTPPVSAGAETRIDTIIGEGGETDRHTAPTPLWPTSAHREAVEELHAQVIGLQADAARLQSTLVDAYNALCDQEARLSALEAKSPVRVSWGDWWARLFPARPAAAAEARQEKQRTPVYYASTLRGS